MFLVIIRNRNLEIRFDFFKRKLQHTEEGKQYPEPWNKRTQKIDLLALGRWVRVKRRNRSIETELPWFGIVTGEENEWYQQYELSIARREHEGTLQEPVESSFFFQEHTKQCLAGK
jgi:hypothetical protein